MNDTISTRFSLEPTIYSWPETTHIVRNNILIVYDWTVMDLCIFYVKKLRMTIYYIKAFQQSLDIKQKFGNVHKLNKRNKF